MDYLKLASELAKAKRQMVKIPDFHRITEPSSGESFVLGYLSERDKPVNPKEISEAMNVSSARIAMIVNRLEEKGMVKREQDPENGRHTIVYLLPAGRRQRQKNIEKFNRCAIRFLKAMEPEDAVEYVRSQSKVAEIYAKYHAAGKKDLYE